MQERTKVLIWDKTDKVGLNVYDGYKKIFLGKVFEEGAFSLSGIIETHSREFRDRYTAMVASMGLYSHENGESLLAQTLIREDFSYWWMTEICEMQHYSRESEIYNIVRCFALEKVIAQFDDIQEVVFFTEQNPQLKIILHEWFGKKGIQFISKDDKAISKKSGKIFSVIKKTVFPEIKAFLFLIQYQSDRLLQRVGAVKKINNNDITFFDYLVNIPFKEGREQKFNSQYWTDLVPFVEKFRVNWLHMWVKAESSGSCKLNEVGAWFSTFSVTTPNHYHGLINGKLSVKIILSTVKDYFKIRKKKKNVYKLVRKYFEQQEHFNFSSFWHQSIENDFSGAQCMWNCLCLNLFEKLLIGAPKQKLGIYLMENVSWENALVYTWKKAGHGTIVGMPHATIRFWDIRYFTHALSYADKVLAKPRPDVTAVNAQKYLDEFIELGHRPESIALLEGLRYLYLNKKEQNVNSGKYFRQNYGFRVLILGDYYWKNTFDLLSMYCHALKHIDEKIITLYKPHPNTNSIAFKPLGNFEITVVNDELGQVLNDVDLVITTNVTSSALDSYCYGINTISALDPGTFNLSPFKGDDNFGFFTTAQELESLIKFHIKGSREDLPDSNKKRSFFYLDNELKGWKLFLYKALNNQ